MLTVCEEEVGEIEMHEKDILGSHAGSVASSLQSVPTAQDINEAQSVASQAKGATSISLAVVSRNDYFVLLLCLIGSGGSDISEKGIEQSRSSDDVNDRLSKAEAQTRAYFLPIVEISII